MSESDDPILKNLGIYMDRVRELEAENQALQERIADATRHIKNTMPHTMTGNPAAGVDDVHMVSCRRCVLLAVLNPGVDGT